MAAENIDSMTRVVSTSDSPNSNVHQNDGVDDDLESWNPMAEDYANKAFNDYKEPTTAELREWMPKPGEEARTGNEDLMACYRSNDGDVRLFVNGIPPDLTQEGIRGLFTQAGKVVYCKVIPHRDPNKRDTFGFVGYQSYREAEKAIRLFDGFSLGENMRLRVSLSKKSKVTAFPSDRDINAGYNAINGDTEEGDWDGQTTTTTVANGDTAVANGDHTIAMRDSSDAMANSTVAMSDNITSDQQTAMNQNGQLSGDVHFTQSENAQKPDITPPREGAYCQPPISSSSSSVDEVNGEVHVDQSAQHKTKIPEGPCSVCGKNGRRRCSSCKAHYCSKECQRTNWPEHKKVCNWKKTENQEIEAKPTKKDEPYVIDEDELDIPDPIAFMGSFGPTVRQDVIHAVPPEAYKQDKYLDFDEEYISVSHPTNQAQITEIEDTSENQAQITEIEDTNDNTTSPLIEEMPTSSSQSLDAEGMHSQSPSLTELNAEHAKPANSGLNTDAVSSEGKEPTMSEFYSKKEFLEPQSQLPFMSEITLEDNTSSSNGSKLSTTNEGSLEDNAAAKPKPLITELPSVDCHTQAPFKAETHERPAETIPQQATRQATKPDEAVNSKLEVFHRYRLADIPCETMTINSWYDIVVTSVSSPNVFWVQLFQIDALERQNTLYQTLEGLYTNSPYKNYVPMVGDVCAAQYTKDDNWYRSKVNYINNNGYINVTHIDFGSSEDVDASSIRRITSDLASIPRQAIKCSLYLPDRSQRDWSPEMIETFGVKVLDVKCSAEVKAVKDNVFYLEIYDESGNKINDVFNKRMIDESAGKTQAASETTNALPEKSMEPLPVSHMSTLSCQTSDSSTFPGQPTQPIPTPSATEPQVLQDQFSETVPTESTTITDVLPGQSVPPPSTSSSTNPVLPGQPSQQELPDSTTTPKVLPEQSMQPTHADSIESNSGLVDQSSSQSLPPEQLPSHIPVTTPDMSDQATQQEPRSNPTANPSFENVDTPVSDQATQQEPRSYPTANPSFENVNTPMSDQASQQQARSNPIANPSSESADRSSGTLSSSSSEVDLKCATPKSPKQGKYIPRPRFEAVVSSVITPREFHMVLTDPVLLEKLEALSTQLQSHCNSSPYDPAVKYDFDEVCAIKSSEDKEWYRGRIMFCRQKDQFAVQLMDLDTKETITPENIRPIPDWFKDLPPRRILCCLGGITKRAGMTIFGRDAIDKFTSLVLNNKFTCQEVSRFKNSYMVDLLDASGQPSVSKELIDAGLVDAFVKKDFRKPVNANSDHDYNFLNPSILLPCKGAITSAKLPLPGQVFQASVTQLESPTAFFIHLNDDQSKQKLDQLSQDMNMYYTGMSQPTDWQARERQLCAAFFKSSWLRAFVQNITEDNVVTIFCVDFGNTEVVSSSALSLLAPQFSTLPYCALHCSIANVSPTQGTEWSKEAVDFVRMKMPLSSTLDVTLIFKGQTILFVDVILPSSETLSQLLVFKNLALRGKAHSSPKNYERSNKQRFSEQGSYQQRFKEGRGPPNRQGSRNDRQFSARAMAISTAKLPQRKETFKVFVTHITSPGSFAIQVADFDMVSKIAALQSDMGNHYNTKTYPPYLPAANQVCAAQFMADDSWYRAWVEKIVDDKVQVYYPDYGNSETLDSSRLRPLEVPFTALPFAALTCSLASITSQGDWSQDAIAMFSDKVQLFQAIDVKLVYRKNDCIFLDIADPQDPSSTISKTLVAKNLAVWMSDSKKPSRDWKTTDSHPLAMPIDVREKKPRIENQENFQENTQENVRGNVQENAQENVQENVQGNVQGNVRGKVQGIVQENAQENVQGNVQEIPVKKFFLDALPLVSVTHGVYNNCMVCDINPQGIVALQILTKDLEELVALGSGISSYCSVDQVPYTPAEGELCFACFTEDKEWYRAVVNDVLPGNQFKVTFVDYGNQDIVSSQSIRLMDEKFLQLPRQAYTGPLKGLASSDQTPLPVEIIEALKMRLLEKRSLLRVCEDGVEFFAVGPDGEPGFNINEDLIQVLYPQVGVPTEIDEEFAAVVTEVHGTAEIWLQRADLSDVIKEIMNDVNAYCESNTASSVTSPPSSGEVLLAKHSFYNKWYRVKVLESQPSVARVLFVDFGYVEEVTLDKLLTTKPELLRLPFQAAKCYLVRVAQGNQSADDFIKQILGREFKAKVCEKKTDLLGVELEDYGVPNGPLNISDYLIGFGYQP